MSSVTLKTVHVHNPNELNLIFGQSHFIKTPSDLFEVLVQSFPGIKFGVAFCEASGPALIRVEGTDEDCKALATRAAQEVGAGHTFWIFLKDCFPVNVLGAVRNVPEVCHIFCATANPLDVVLAENEQGRGVLGVIDGISPKGVESAEDREKRHQFLRTIGYKL